MIKTSAEFILLRNSDIPEEYNRAGIEEAPLTVWMDLIENHHDMKVWVARNRMIPKEIIHILSKDSDPIVRHAISMKYPLDIEIYSQLAKDSDEGIRAQLANNKRLPVFLLKQLAYDDPSEFVRKKALSKYRER